jgi:hypothetical protein
MTDKKENENNLVQHHPALIRGKGVTPAELYLNGLCDKSFLSLWSYPGIFRDQGKTSLAGDGKEICDHLVVF